MSILSIALVGMIFLSIPEQSAFADTTKIDIVPKSSVPGCEKQGVGQCYFPSRPTIAVGDKVIWKNQDTAAHTVTSGSPSSGANGFFDSGLMLSGKSYGVQFKGEGSYHYFCIVHPWMKGKITVEDNPAQFHTMFLNVSPSTVIDGDRAVVTGQLIATVPIDAYKIFVRYKTNTGISGSEWLLDDGHFKMNVIWPVGIHKLQFFYDSEWGLIASNPVTLTIKKSELPEPKITLNRFSPSMTYDDDIEISGRLTTQQGAPIFGKTVWIDADGNGRGKSKTAVTDSSGYFSATLYSWAKQDMGNWMVNAYFERDGDFSDTQSSKYRLTVTDKAPPPAQTAPTISVKKEDVPQLVSTDASFDVILKNSQIKKTSDGRTVVTGIIENKKDFAISGVKIWVGFYDSSGNSQIQSVTGSSTQDVIPANSKGTFTISSTSKNPNISRVSTNLLGWNSAPTPTSVETSSSIKVGNTDYILYYKIAGGKILNAITDTAANSVKISLSSTSDGKFKVALPRELIDAKINDQDVSFFVLVDGEEMDFSESKNSSHRGLGIKFPNGAEEIEIIGSFVYPNTYSYSDPYSQTTSTPSTSTTSTTKSSSDTFKSYADTGSPSSTPTPTKMIQPRLTLDEVNIPVYHGDVIFISGKIDVGNMKTKGLTIILKDHDAYGIDDELAIGFVNSDGTFSIPWIARSTDTGKSSLVSSTIGATDLALLLAGYGNPVGFLISSGVSLGMELGNEFFFAPADVYAVFEGNEQYLPITSCGKSIITEIDSCDNTLQLEIIEPLGGAGKAVRAFINSLPFGDYNLKHRFQTIDMVKQPYQDAEHLPAIADLKIRILEHASHIYYDYLKDASNEMKDAKAFKEWRKAQDAYQLMDSKLKKAESMKLIGELMIKQKDNRAWDYLTGSIDLVQDTWEDFDNISEHTANAYRIQYWE